MAPAACSLLVPVSLLSACVYDVPLGGIAPSHARPLPGRSFELGPSIGLVPDISEMIPEIEMNGRVLNQVRADDPHLTTAGWGPFGLAMGAGLTDWLDLGFTSWRGFYSTVRLLEGRSWALSASPAFFFHRVADETYFNADVSDGLYAMSMFLFVASAYAFGRAYARMSGTVARATS